MARPLKAGIAPYLDLGATCILQFAAISPTTGAAVSGVTVSGANLTVANIAGGDLDNLLEQIDPLFIPVPIDAASGGA